MRKGCKGMWVLPLLVAVAWLALPSNVAAIDTLDSVLVVPNPYNVSGRTHGPPSNLKAFEKIAFTNLPSPCTIRIYTSAGNLVMTLEHTGAGIVKEWNGRNSDNQYIVSDLYIYVVEATDTNWTGPRVKIGKFMVIR